MGHQGQDPLAVLGAVFGHAGFLPGQRDAVECLLRGRDALVIAPPSGGKTTAFHVAALCRGGTALVVSPRTSAMREATLGLRLDGIRAAALHGAVPQESVAGFKRAFLSGTIDVLHVSPDVLLSEGMLRFLGRGPVTTVAYDDAEALSALGPGFQPGYLDLGVVARAFPGAPRAALLASPSPAIADELRDRFDLGRAATFRSSFDKPSLRMSVIPKDNPRRQLLAFVERHPGEAGVVHCHTPRSVEATAAFLSKAGRPAMAWHVEMSSEDRATALDAFAEEPGSVLVRGPGGPGAGMRPDLRFVVHMDMPEGIEAYYRDCAEAGRDGGRCEAVMFYGLSDLVSRRQMIVEGGGDAAVRRHKSERLAGLVAVCEGTGCRREGVLEGLGEGGSGPCGNCDACLAPIEAADEREAGQVLLSAMSRTDQEHGAGHVVAVVRGVHNDKVVRLHHDQVRTFGKGKAEGERFWQDVVRRLLVAGAIDVDTASFGRLVAGPLYREYLHGLRDLPMQRRAPAHDPGPVPETRDPDPLEVDLMAARAAAAARKGIPPRLLIPDAVLGTVARLRPATAADLRTVPGLGEARAFAYGPMMLSVLAAHAPRGPAP